MNYRKVYATAPEEWADQLLGSLPEGCIPCTASRLDSMIDCEHFREWVGHGFAHSYAPIHKLRIDRADPGDHIVYAECSKRHSPLVRYCWLVPVKAAKPPRPAYRTPQSHASRDQAPHAIA